MLLEILSTVGAVVGGAVWAKETLPSYYYSTTEGSNPSTSTEPCERDVHPKALRPSTVQALQYTSRSEDAFETRVYPRSNRFLRRSQPHMGHNFVRSATDVTETDPSPCGTAPRPVRGSGSQTRSHSSSSAPTATVYHHSQSPSFRTRDIPPVRLQPGRPDAPSTRQHSAARHEQPSWGGRLNGHSFPVPVCSAPNLVDNSCDGPTLIPDVTPSPRSGIFAAPKYVNGLCGLRNLGNTCYMNACLQCLLHTDPIVEYFLDGHFLKVLRQSRRHAPLTEAVADLIEQQQRGAKKVINPSALKSAVGSRLPSFAGFNQQDAQEFLRFTLDNLHEELNRVTGKVAYEELKDIPGETDWQGSGRWWANHRTRNDSFLMDLFCGQLKSHVTCRRCGYLSKAFDPFMDLSLPLKGESIEDCLAQFMEPERLQGSERFYCPACKAQVDSTRKLSVYRWPEVLVIHLKRFSYIGFGSKKLNNDISFGRQMNLNAFSDADAKLENLTYRLYAVVNHIGSAGGGHYTASCMQQSSDPSSGWFNFDDSHVQSTPVLPLHGSTAYILFYTRVLAAQRR
eukprot:GGOE01036646.1.p1 GENE.GGOE01036646.1~~GGOE01036646.1.p1  ORF type:complete len:566 (+),score=63.56 GGOE01036646.1:83-1780(+)